MLFTAIDEGYAICEMLFDGGGKPKDYRFLETNMLFDEMAQVTEASGQTALTLIPHLDRSWIDRFAQVTHRQETIRFQHVSQDLGRVLDVFATPLAARDQFAIVCRDVTARNQADEQRELLVSELNHRIKNILATVQAIASQTLQGAASLSDFHAAFSGRLQAIAIAHDTTFAPHEPAKAFLRDLILKIVGPYVGGEGDRLTLVGPRVQLDTPSAHGMSLILHELATNAAKYGALTTSEGAVSLSWTLELGGSAPILALTWRERGGPTVKRPERSGFGTRLITSALAQTRGSKTDLRFDPLGVCVDIVLPLH